ncbi:MAG: hypothetical protein QG632_885, partial [Candidatus Dependentiae bacterium]|nr:hypothetical protein [Candidatus Dependentiae bacterium]
AETPGFVVANAALGQEIEELVRTGGQFLPRPEMEEEFSYKQIIPYTLFIHNRQVFVMQRSRGAGEQRLAEKYTIGIGGHVRKKDLTIGGLAEWGRREFEEEIAYAGQYCGLSLFGLVNDDSNAVGQVHLGVVFVLEGSTNRIEVRSELKSGMLMDREACLMVRAQMETWSQFVLDALIKASVI